MSFQALLKKLIENPRDWSSSDLEQATQCMLQNKATPAQMGGFLVGLKLQKLEWDPQTIATMTKTMLSFAMPLQEEGDSEYCDIVGTGT